LRRSPDYKSKITKFQENSPNKLRNDLEKRRANKVDMFIPNALIVRNRKRHHVKPRKFPKFGKRTNIVKNLTLENLTFKLVKKPNLTPKPNFSLQNAEITSTNENRTQLDNNLFKKIKKMVLPKLKLENTIYQSTKSRL
jgi:hypothetical protein